MPRCPGFWLRPSSVAACWPMVRLVRSFVSGSGRSATRRRRRASTRPETPRLDVQLLEPKLALTASFVTKAMPISVPAAPGVAPAGFARSASAPASAASPSALATERLVAQGIVANPVATATILPAGARSPVSPATPGTVQPGTVQTVTVATLQSNYETLFGDLNPKLGVTLGTRQNVAKIDYLKGQSAAGYFDLLAKPIQNNPVGVTAVTFQPVTYQTTVALPAGTQSFRVSGGLILPQGIGKTQIKGVVVYFHGTTFDKSSVPSNASVEAQLCGQLFASQGYIVVAPDYIGQGVDWKNVHPYVLYPQVSAKTAIDMLTAVKPLIAAQYRLTAQDPALKLFSVGYSEGGAYSLWFNSVISGTPRLLDPFYALTHSAGLEGAYDTSKVVSRFLFSDVGKGLTNPYNIQSQALTNFVKPLLTADALLSFGRYGMNGDYGKVFNPGYFRLTATSPIPQSSINIDGKNLDIAKAFAQPSSNIMAPLFLGAVNKRANWSSYLYPVVLAPTDTVGKLALALRLAESTRNNMHALTSSHLLTGMGKKLLDRALAAADVNLTPSANGGVSIITLAKDSVVTPNNFDALLKAYPGKIANAIKLDENDFMVVSGVSGQLGRAVWVPTDHMHGLIYEFVYALHIFNTYAGGAKPPK